MTKVNIEMTKPTYGFIRNHACSGLEEIGQNLKSLYPNVELQPYLNHILLSSLVFRMVCSGWTKEQLLDEINYEVNEAVIRIDELNVEEMRDENV